MKRFTETEKWSDPWFAVLESIPQLVWLFLCDQCDEAGFWTVNLRDLQHFTRATPAIWEQFLADAGDNRLRLVGSKVWIVKFIDFQFPRGIHQKNLRRVAIERSLRKAPSQVLLRGLQGAYRSLIYSLLEAPSQGHASTCQGAEEKEQEKDKVLLGIGECRGEREPAQANAPGVSQANATTGQANGPTDRKPMRASPDASRPSIDEVQAFAATIGLAPWKAADWFNEMEGCGWLDFSHRPVVAWTAVLTRVRTKWEADGRPTAPPSSQANATVRPPTANDLRNIVAAKQSIADDLKNRFCSESALSEHWSDAKARAQFIQLRREIKEVTTKISKMA